MTLRKWWKLFLNIIYCWGLEYFCNKSLTLPLNSLHCSPTAWHMHGRHSYMYKAWRYTHISLYSRSVIEHPLKVRCQSSHAIKKQVLLFCCWRETVNACIYIFFSFDYNCTRGCLCVNFTNRCTPQRILLPLFSLFGSLNWMDAFLYLNDYCWDFSPSSFFGVHLYFMKIFPLWMTSWWRILWFILVLGAWYAVIRPKYWTRLAEQFAYRFLYWYWHVQGYNNAFAFVCEHAVWRQSQPASSFLL
jgi:hypothetical protein